MTALAHRSLERIPPQNIEAEMALIGAILVDASIMPVVADIVRATDFYGHVHETIWQSLVALFDASKPLDKVSLAGALRDRGVLEKVGGPSYLSSLMESVQTAQSASYYAKIVRQKALLRGLIHAGGKIIDLGFAGEEDPEQALDDSEQALFAVSARPINAGVEMHDAVLAVYNVAVNGGRKGLKTGFPAFDQHTTGLHGTRLYLLAARPGAGKSSLVMCIGANVAEAGGAVHVFSLEMSAEDFAQRLIAGKARMDLRQLVNGKLAQSEIDAMYEASVWASSLPITVDTSARSIESLVSAARRVHAKKPQALYIVDYLQLLCSERVRYGANRNEELAAISRRLKLLAVELNVPILALSQMNRDVENRPDKRPTLADLRDSGALEQDADLVGFIHRPWMYDKNADESDAELIVAKHRYGPQTDPGDIMLRFVPRSASFENP